MNIPIANHAHSRVDTSESRTAGTNAVRILGISSLKESLHPSTIIPITAQPALRSFGSVDDMHYYMTYNNDYPYIEEEGIKSYRCAYGQCIISEIL